MIFIDQRLQKSNPLKAELIQIGDLGSVSLTSRKMPRSEYISTRWYRAPECLLTSGYYGPKMDIWALGCCFYEMMELQPLFPGENELDQLHKIHEIVGTPTREQLSRFKHLSAHIDFPKTKPIPMEKLITNLSNYGLDFMQKMITYHPDSRPRAERLLEHVYFEETKRQAAKRSSVHNRLLYVSKSDNSRAPRSRSSSSSHNRSQNTSNASSRDGNFRSQSLRRLNVLTKKYTKELERNWNRNECPTKQTILKNLKSSVTNQKNAISLESSLMSCQHRRI